MSPTESSNSDEWVVDSFTTTQPPLDEARLVQYFDDMKHYIDDKLSVALQSMDRKMDHLMIEMKKIHAEPPFISTLHSMNENSKTIMSTIENLKSETLAKTTDAFRLLYEKINSAFQCLDEKIDCLLESRKAAIYVVDTVTATTDRTSANTVDTPFLQEPEVKTDVHLDSFLTILDTKKSSNSVGVAMEEVQFVTTQTGTTTVDTELLQVPKGETDSHLAALLQRAVDESNKSMDRNTAALITLMERNSSTMTDSISSIRQKADLVVSLLESLVCSAKSINQHFTKDGKNSEHNLKTLHTGTETDASRRLASTTSGPRKLKHYWN